MCSSEQQHNNRLFQDSYWSETGMHTISHAIIVIDWVMKNTVKDRTGGIRWGTRGQLEDSDFADELAIMSHSHKQLLDKINRLIHFANK